MNSPLLWLRILLWLYSIWCYLIVYQTVADAVDRIKNALAKAWERIKFRWKQFRSARA